MSNEIRTWFCFVLLWSHQSLVNACDQCILYGCFTDTHLRMIGRCQWLIWIKSVGTKHQSTNCVHISWDACLDRRNVHLRNNVGVAPMCGTSRINQTTVIWVGHQHWAVDIAMCVANRKNRSWLWINLVRIRMGLALTSLTSFTNNNFVAIIYSWAYLTITNI